MDQIWNAIVGLFSDDRLTSVVRATITLIVGLLLARLVSISLGRLLTRRGTPQQSLIARRVSFYVIFGLVLMTVLGQLGFDLSVLLGAAGILTVALGFASQTSASNLISGLFLLGERPFVVGDVIRVEGTTGEVISIDLLSVKLRTFDNLFVRVPNESLLKAQITNLTHFPIRRVDLVLGVAYRENLERVREVLVEVAVRHPLCLDEPAALFIVTGFGDSSIDLQFSVWAARENYLEVKTGIQQSIKQAFDDAAIEIPFPHRSLYTGSVTEPFPVRVVQTTAQKAIP